MKLSPAAAYLLDVLNDSGYGAWLVGGCVRDSLRNITPHDFDIATTALPKQVMSCFPDFHVVPTGIRHGTVSVVADGELLEITTLRADGDYGDGRRPDEVTFVGNIEADLARRDFTINAIAWNSHDGIIDPFGGQVDIARGILRCVGDPVTRLREDSLRVMRCLRFAACLGFVIEPKTAAALHSEREGLKRVSPERLGSELSRLICGEQAGQVASDYRDILAVILPEIILDVDKSIFDSLESDCAMRLALLLGASPPELPLGRLRFDNDTVRRASVLCALMRLPLPCSRADAATMTLSAGRERMEELTQIWRAQAATEREGSVHHLPAVEYARQVMNCGCCSVGELAIDGNTLIDMGMLPGRRIGRLLVSLAESVMAGSCRNEVRPLTELARQLYREEKI